MTRRTRASPRPWAWLLTVALLAGCASRAPRVPDIERDGPEARPPIDLHLVPDAVPRLEPLRLGGPNKPYEVAGQRFAPLLDDPAISERGLASWYGRKFHGRPTANGETYDMYAMTAAHRTMPIPSYARVRNPANDREVIVRINDRGPFHPDRVIDLSYTAALKLGLLGGVAPVVVERLTNEAIRNGRWRRAPAAEPAEPSDPIAEIARRVSIDPR
ncbi:MAG: septal ring lytic transglycosylase RlpA family protein [Burkholderiales bacterium]|nr:septal ring lytic transglycosylase RlpA family protein [Burkholderiales bacterium]